MAKSGVLEKNKNKILNLGVVLLALFIAFQIYRSGDEKANSLVQEKDNEVKKNMLMEEISGLEKKMDGYKKVFVKKDIGSVMDSISAIAKNCSVKVVSIKPSSEESFASYIKTSFLLTISAPNYHSLGDFISQVESYKDIYIVDEVSVALAESNRPEEVVTENLNVNLKISTIAYL
ncbi:MAG: type 4a pilus biogenesis protein PilO [Candidatus Omnitrophica bacterium]|nr:type 4a pilus biogenesis protein PilO [Candidatus Omnitrophota bacterium]